MSLAPRAVVVHRQTEREQLVERHGTPAQAAFVLARRRRSTQTVERRHVAQLGAMDVVANAIPVDWRRGRVGRDELDRFVFGPEDVVIVVGQDGLVANVAKYLDGQVVVGVNPDPERNPGVLVRHPPEVVARLLARVPGGALAAKAHRRTMVVARTDDGQAMVALNEVYVGHPSHQSARYLLEAPTAEPERQSSSGVLVGTGTGATGWCRSVWLERRSSMRLPEVDEPRLCWFAREAWPSPTTGTSLTEGTLGRDDALVIVAESDLVVFGDGIESDAIQLTFGQRLTVGLSRRQLLLA